MLVGIGPRTESQDLVDLLMACHARIRRFIALAARIAADTQREHAEIVEACRQCERYFCEALPLHVADEDHSVLPRLVALGGAVEAALVEMEAQHRGHEPLLQAFVVALRAVAAEPGVPQWRTSLAEVTERIDVELEAHLRLEEQTIFPAIRAHLSSEERAAVVEELRARRR